MSRTRLRPLLFAPCAVLAACGCAPRGAPSSAIEGPLGESRPGEPIAKAPASWLAQAWAAWRRSQASPAPTTALPAPRFVFQAPPPLASGSVSLVPETRAITLRDRREAFNGFGFPTFAIGGGRLASGVAGNVGGLWPRVLSGLSTTLGGGGGGGLVVSDWSALQDRVEARQVAALRERALRVARLRSEAGADQEGLLLTDLHNDLERLSRLDLDALLPNVPSEEEALRLSNLRLKLLATLALPPAQKEAAQQERIRIETEIREALRRQEIERRDLLQKLRREVPAQLEARRLADIESALQQVRESDARAIASLLSQQQERVRRDFAAPARLGIGFPSSSPARSQISFNKDYLRTFVPGSASLAPVTPPAPVQVRLPRLVPAARTLPEQEASRTSSPRGGQQERLWGALLRRRAAAWRVSVR